MMITVQNTTGQLNAIWLFDIFAALARGEIESFPALRPHQREPWHAFCVQVAAMALIRAGRTDLPHEAGAWRDLLIGLTPDWPGGEAWALAGDDWAKPALLQPPLVAPANRADYRARVATPDALDMLVTSRNHDVKAARMADARDEDWLFALVTLQTTEGYLGAGNFGISRMNGGFASRMALGIRPAGNLSAAFGRDVSRLVGRAGAVPRGHAVLWALPWDGTTQLVFDTLDPLYVDVCRRVRLVRGADGRLSALTAGSRVARVAAAALNGNTGDPWAPIRLSDNASVTASQATFGYRKFTELLDREKIGRAPLAEPVEADGEGLVLVAAALVRGQGKTEGLHRRSVPLSRERFQGRRGTAFIDRMGAVAVERAREAGEARIRLRRALLALMQGGPDRVRLEDKSSESKCETWLHDYDRTVDRVFFDDAFWAEFDAAALPHRTAWRSRLRGIAGKVFDVAAEAAPRTDVRRIRAHAVARNMFDAAMSAYLKDVSDA